MLDIEKYPEGWGGLRGRVLARKQESGFNPISVWVCGEAGETEVCQAYMNVLLSHAPHLCFKL